MLASACDILRVNGRVVYLGTRTASLKIERNFKVHGSVRHQCWQRLFDVSPPFLVDCLHTGSELTNSAFERAESSVLEDWKRSTIRMKSSVAGSC